MMLLAANFPSILQRKLCISSQCQKLTATTTTAWSSLFSTSSSLPSSRRPDHHHDNYHLTFNNTHIQSRRWYSPTPPTTQSSQENNNTTNASANEQRTWTLLYHRPPSRSTYPRGMLGFSTLNLTYWTWYVADFTPAINASAHAKAALGQLDPATLELLLIDPNMGYCGLGVSLLIWGGALSYTRNLVTAIWKSQTTTTTIRNDNHTSENENDGSFSLAISTHTLPFVKEPSILSKAIYDPNDNQFDGVETVAFTESELRSDSNVKFFNQGEIMVVGEKDVNDVLIKFDGKMSRKRGHVALQVQNPSNDEKAKEEEDGPLSLLMKQNYLLDIGSDIEVMPGANPHLLTSLVIKDSMRVGKRSITGKRGQKMAKMAVKNDAEREESGVVDDDSSKVNLGESIMRKKGFGKKKR